MSDTHSFNKLEAIKYGINKAVLLKNIRFWLEKNRANKSNAFDGCYWTYNTTQAFSELFPYFSSKSISRWLNELEIDGVIKSSKNYNKMKFDRTKWYTILNEFSTISQSEEAFSQSEETIPDINTNIKPDIEDLPTRELDFKTLVKSTWVDLGGNEFLPVVEAQKFFLHFSESNGKKMAFEKCKTFDIRKRMHKWKLNGYSKQSYSEGRNNA